MAQMWAAKFFFLASPVTRYHDQLSSCTISEKTNYSILRKFSEGGTNRQKDRLTDRQTDRQTDRTDRWMDRQADGQTNKWTDGQTRVIS